MQIKAIETSYSGHRFRSRLEARWAIAFDAMGLSWTYEPEGYHLPSGRMYLPDFRVEIADGTLWVEVKPEGGDVSKFEEFMAAREDTDRGTVLSEIPNVSRGPFLDQPGGYAEVCLWSGDNLARDDAPYQFCECEFCGAIGFTYEARSRRIRCCDANREASQHPGKGPRCVASGLIQVAFITARSARFEHGETHGNSTAFRSVGSILGGNGLG